MSPDMWGDLTPAEIQRITDQIRADLANRGYRVKPRKTEPPTQETNR